VLNRCELSKVQRRHIARPFNGPKSSQQFPLRIAQALHAKNLVIGLVRFLGQSERLEHLPPTVNPHEAGNLGMWPLLTLLDTLLI
jgi:hypothetical protein